MRAKLPKLLLVHSERHVGVCVVGGAASDRSGLVSGERGTLDDAHLSPPFDMESI